MSGGGFIERWLAPRIETSSILISMKSALLSAVSLKRAGAAATRTAPARDDKGGKGVVPSVWSHVRKDITVILEDLKDRVNRWFGFVLSLVWRVFPIRLSALLQRLHEDCQISASSTVGLTPEFALKNMDLNEQLTARSLKSTPHKPRIEARLLAGYSNEIVVRMMFGALEDGSRVRKAKLMAAQLPDSSAAAQELIFRFAFDPRVARHLLARPVAEIGTQTWNRDLSKLMGWAAAGRESSAPRENKPLRFSKSKSEERFEPDPEQNIPDEFFEVFGPMDLSREKPSKNVDWRVRSQRPITHRKRDRLQSPEG